ncbi:MAG: N-methyl-L-tryptophan oxidase [Chloroflexi bacterium]|nr:N-methyl-L-tryptophan oxidase [Chloroflexota bacterium]
MKNTDVLVIGAGVMGASAAYHAARAGAHVRLIEQFRIGHSRGSSHGASRIIRLAYAQPEYVALAKSAYALWRDLERESGATLYFKTGGFDFGAPDAHGLAEIGHNYREQNIEHEMLDAAEIMRRFPQFRLPSDTVGFYQPDYGMLHADRCVATLAAQARAHGAEICEEEPVLKIVAHADSVEVHTTKTVHHAARVVLCAGSWMRPLLQQLGIHLPLVVQKEQVQYMPATNPSEFEIGRFPLFIHRFAGTTSLAAGFPVLGYACPKFLIDHIGARVEPEDDDRAVDVAMRERTRDYALEHVRGLTGEVVEAVSCRYTMTPDEDFLIDRHPLYPHLIMASPCSGHGFKFGSVVGEVLAELALRGATRHDIARFRLDRPGLRDV